MPSYEDSTFADEMGEEQPKKPTKTALVAAVDILARQEHSEKKLVEKLTRKGYAEDEIAGAIARLKEKHYLDDEAACQRQFDYLYNESRKSVMQICVKLTQRGFASSLVRACVPSDIFARESAAALKFLQLKYKPTADRQKMMASLYRAGFQGSAIHAAIDDFCADDEDE